MENKREWWGEIGERHIMGNLGIRVKGEKLKTHRDARAVFER